MSDQQSHESNPSRLLTAREAAEFLSVSERTVWALISSGELPAIQISRGRKGIMARDLEEFVEARRVRGPRS